MFVYKDYECENMEQLDGVIDAGRRKIVKYGLELSLKNQTFINKGEIFFLDEIVVHSVYAAEHFNLRASH